jgi:hypothetical protein
MISMLTIDLQASMYFNKKYRVDLKRVARQSIWQEVILRQSDLTKMHGYSLAPSTEIEMKD